MVDLASEIGVGALGLGWKFFVGKAKTRSVSGFAAVAELVSAGTSDMVACLLSQ